jgi:acylphosphatase
MITEYYLAWGKVQGVMFRQTFIRACKKRNIQAGATNENIPDKNLVSFTVQGKENQLKEFILTLDNFIKNKKTLNSWGAIIEKLEKVNIGKDIEEHEVTTNNIDSFKWNPNVSMYI